MSNNLKTTGLVYRAAELCIRQAENDESNRITVIASTNENYNWGYFREQLLHGDENVDRSAAVSVLFNHSRDQVIGKILSTKLDGKKMTAPLEIDPDVKGSNGLQILKAIRKGYIKGVSIGYEYDREDCDVFEDDNGVRNVRVKKWRLREISITPTQADLSAHVKRELPADWFRAAPARQQQEENRMSEKNKVSAGAAVADPAKVSADELANERKARETAEREAKQHKTRLELLEMARSHGLNDVKASDLEGKSREDGILYLLNKAAEQKREIPEGSTAVDIDHDAVDKANEAAEDALLYMAGVKQTENKGMRGHSILEIGRKWAYVNGKRDVHEMTREQLARFMLNRFDRHQGTRDAANVTSGDFATYLFANTMEKLIHTGFDAFEKNVSYPQWTNERKVSDFKAFTGAALDVGNLVETTENIAFPELTKSEGGYSDSLGLWGATVSLSFQALVNDDLGEFMRRLGQAGAISRRTIDKQVYTKLAAATWTNRTVAAGGLDDDKLGQVRGLLQQVTGPAGEVLGNDARFLLVPSGLFGKARAIAPLLPNVNPTSNPVNLDIIPVVTPHLATAGTAAESTYYIAADPNIADTVIVVLLNGMEQPVVEEYDAGAVAARKWKLMLPFVVVVPTGLYGLYQATYS